MSLLPFFWLSRLKIYGFVPIWGLWLEKKPSEGPENKNDPIFDIFRAFLSENISFYVKIPNLLKFSCTISSIKMHRLYISSFMISSFFALEKNWSISYKYGMILERFK